MQWSGTRARALNYSSVYKVKTKTGRWQGRIGCQRSLASANWLDFRMCGLSRGAEGGAGFVLVLISLNQATGSLIGRVLAPAEDDLSSSLAITQPLCKGDLGLPWPLKPVMAPVWSQHSPLSFDP